MKNILIIIFFIFIVNGLQSEQLTVLKPGSLSSLIMVSERVNIIELRLIGNINASDVKFIRDQLPNLTYLDLSKSKLNAYQGVDGTSVITSYKEDEMPEYSFYNGEFGKTTLTEVVLPDSLCSIAQYAFGYCSNISKFVIPPKVSNIAENAFYFCTGVCSFEVNSYSKSYSSVDGILFNFDKSILVKYPAKKKGKYTVPSTVKVIGAKAFSMCTSLDEIIIPSTVTNILYKSFYGCNKLNKLVLPNSINYLGEAAFMFCDNLSEVELSNNLNSILPYTFAECKKLSKITLPGSIRKIREYSFSNCEALCGELEIPDLVDTIGDGVFNKCIGINSIKLPISLKYIGCGAFKDCANLEEINLPEVIELNTGLFKGCARLNSLVIPQSVRKIKKYCFSSCLTLNEISLPTSIYSIDEGAFERCVKLKNINLPKNLNYLGIWIFKGCTNLETIYSEIENPINVSNFKNIFRNDKLSKCYFYVPKGTIGNYIISGYAWKFFKGICEN